MKWWWSSSPSNPQTTGADRSNQPATPAPSPAKSHTPHQELVESKAKGTSQDGAIEHELAQYMPVFAKSELQTPEEIRNAKQTPLQRSPFDETVYPDTMSCRDAFDQAMHCRGPGGQFVNLYRHGEFRQCSEHWSQFWFCMRTRTKPAAIKRELIKDFYKEKEEAKYAGKPSSEDIWEQREARLQRAFDANISQIDQLPLEDSRERRRQLKTVGETAGS